MLVKLGKILEPFDIVCLFCGENMVQKWDDREMYHDCDCADTKDNERIDEEIRKLEQCRPKPKYVIKQVRSLKKIKSYE